MAPSFGESLVHQHTILAPSTYFPITHQTSKNYVKRKFNFGELSFRDSLINRREHADAWSHRSHRLGTTILRVFGPSDLLLMSRIGAPF